MFTTDTQITSTSGHKVKALKIFSYMINRLKDHCLATITRNNVSRPTPDIPVIQLVLTVPAIWSDTAKDLMCQAACEAGLSATKDSDFLMITLKSGAYESLYRNPVSIYSSTREIKPIFMIDMGLRYQVIDAGGGIIDITQYTVSHLEIVNHYSHYGGACGCFQLDKKFKKFENMRMNKKANKNMRQRMNAEKLKQLQEQVRIGGKGSARRKKKIVHKSATTEHKKLQTTLKKLGVNPVCGIEEVNIINKDGSVIHLNNPKVQASLGANIFAIIGEANN
jgi:hypothetical protein